MKIGYARTSTREQHLDRQLIALKEAGCEIIHEEQQSGKNISDRPILSNLLEMGLRKEDTLVVVDFSRLARNSKDLLLIIETVEKIGCNLVSLKEGLDLSTPYGRMVVTILSSIYQFERENTLDRQKMGIAAAKLRGAYTGGKCKEYDVAVFKGLYEQYKAKQITKVQFAKSMNCSRPTLDKWLREYKEAC